MARKPNPSPARALRAPKVSGRISLRTLYFTEKQCEKTAAGVGCVTPCQEHTAEYLRRSNTAVALRARCGAVPDIKLNPFLRACAIVAKVVDLDAAGNILEAARVWIKARARESSCFA